MRADLRKSLILTQSTIIILGVLEIALGNRLGIAFVSIAFVSLCNVVRNRDS